MTSSDRDSVVPEKFNLAKDTFIYGVSMMMVRSAGVISAPILTRLLSVEDYGSREIISVTISMLLMFIGMNMNLGFSRFYFMSEDRSYKKDVFTSSLLISTALITLIVLLFLILKHFMVYSLQYEEIQLYDKYVNVALIAVPFNVMINKVNALLRLSKRSLAYSLISVSQVVMSLCLIILLLSYYNTGLIGAFWATTVTTIVISVISILLVRKEIAFRIDVKLISKIVRYSMPSFPAVLINWGVKQSNKFIIVYYLGLSAFGIYSIGHKIAIIILSIIAALRLALDPYVFSLFEKKNSVNKIESVYNTYLFIMIGVTLVLSISADNILYIMAPAEYSGAVILIPILSFGYALYLIVHFMTFRIYASPNKNIYITYISIIVFFVVIGGNLLLIPLIGILGTAVSQYLGYLVSIILQHSIRSKLKTIDFKIFNHVLQILLFTAVFVINIRYDGVFSPYSDIFLISVFLFVNKSEAIRLLKDLKRNINHRTKIF
jgi:O-antigen/teichoic acid export membrane protein